MKSNKLASLYDRICLGTLALLMYALLFKTIPYELILDYLPRDSFFFYTWITAGQVLAIAFLGKYAKLHPFQKGGLFTVSAIESLVVVIYMLYVGYTGSIDPSLILNIYAGIVGILIAFTILGIRNLALKDNIEPNSEPNNEDKLKSWLNSRHDYPLDLENGRANQIERISEHLISGSCQHGMVIFGEYGAGKTTLIESIKNELPNKHWNIVHFSAWEKEKLVPLILKDIINVLSKNFEIHQVEMLPNSMVKALGKGLPAQGIEDSLINALQPSYKPIELVEKLNDLLIQQDDHCLVIVEDVDRGKHAVDNLNALSALFNLITRSDRINFIFTLEDKQEHHTPLTKILYHRETLEDLNPLIVILSFIDLCRNEAVSEGVILTDQNFGHPRNLMPEGNISKINELSRRTIYGDLAKALLNPRDLTASLKSAWLLWDKVKGEVNILDVLIYRVILNLSTDHCARKVIENWSVIRRNAKENESTKNVLVKEINEENPYFNLVSCLISGGRANNEYQSIRLDRDIYGNAYLDILKNQRTNNRIPVTQARLQLLKSIWSKEWEPTVEIVKELFDDVSQYRECYLAYKGSQDPAKYEQYHGRVLEEILKYTIDPDYKLEDVPQHQYESRIEPICHYLGWFLFIENEQTVAWIDSLNSHVNNCHRTRWVLINIYQILIKGTKYSLSKSASLKVSDSLKELLTEIDFHYVLDMPRLNKWNTITSFNPNWSGSKDIKQLSKLTPKDLVVQSIKVLTPFITIDEFDIEWTSKINKVLRIDQSSMQCWLYRLKDSCENYLFSNETPKEICFAIEAIVIEYSSIKSLSHEACLVRFKDMVKSISEETINELATEE